MASRLAVPFDEAGMASVPVLRNSSVDSQHTVASIVDPGSMVNVPELVIAIPES